MGPTSPMDFKDQLKAQVDIVRVASDYVRLRRVGNRYSGLCPFHNEKTPSFSVSAEHQFFRCFGCDAKGDVFSFVMMIEGLTFWEALRKLADQHGIALPKQSAAGDEETRLRAALYEMHEIACEHFRRNLAGPQGETVRAYIAKRGVAESTVEKFGLGLADGSGRALLRTLQDRGFRPEQLESSGLVAQREDGSFYDRFRNRLMFPIQNETGKTIAFGGRALDPADKAKYLNSPETKIYRKSSVLYNLNRAKETAMKLDRIVLVEGYMDAIGAWQAGITEVVASCGTALTTEQVRAMKRHSQNLHLNFDPDAAGANAAERSIKLLLDENVRVRIVELEGGLDPDEYCKEQGAEAYRHRVAVAKTYFYWLADRARARFNMREPQGRMDAFQFLLPAIQGLNDKLERVAVANDLASYLGVAPGLVLDHFRKVAADRVERSPIPKAEPASATERMLLPVLLTDNEGRPELVSRLRQLSSWKQFPTASIYELVIAAHDAGDSISFESVHARVSPAQQELLTSIVLERDSIHPATFENAMSSLDALRRIEIEPAIQDLKSRIKTAEREGRLREAFELTEQLNGIVKNRERWR